MQLSLVDTYTIEKFQFKHLGELGDWIKNRGLALELIDQLPEHGIILPGVCAGFIRQCEGQVALIDSLISNPEAPPATRDLCLTILNKALIDLAKSLKFSKLIAFSSDSHTVARAKSLGFEVLPHTLLGRSL